MGDLNETQAKQDYKIIVVDNEKGIESLSTTLKESGYKVTGITDVVEAIKLIKNEHFDLLLLNFSISTYNGEEVVEEIRKFNKELYILILIENNKKFIPLETIKKLDIQGYWEKKDNFDQLLLLVEFGIKSIKQMREIKRINNELVETKDKLEKSYLENIQTLRYTVEAKDPYTRGHSDRVSEFAVLIGKKMGLEEKDLKTLRIGGLFHDIGKIGIPDSILLKKSKLSDDEYSKIKNHPSIGAKILSNSTNYADIIPFVKYHHERYDGKGYPDNLVGKQIPLMARITAVADSFDAMSSKRTYRDSMKTEVIIDEIRKNKGSQFDPEIADVFLGILENDYDSIKKIQDKY